MKAVAISEYLDVSDPNCFINVELDDPKPVGRDLLVEIRAISINPVDTKVRKPKEKKETSPRILGWDAAGVVVETGSDCTLFNKGDAVYFAGDLGRAGSNAQYQVVDERIVGSKPKSLSYEDAAALPLTALTAWEVLFDRLGFSPDGTGPKNARNILIIGGAGGVGSIATQIAKSVAKIATVITTASRDESTQWCKKMGADHVISHAKPLLPQLQELGFDTVDTIFCCAPTEMYFEQFRDLITPQGHIASIVETTGGVPLAMNALQGKSASFSWGFMFTRSMHATPDIQAQHDILNSVSKLIDEGVLKTTAMQNLGPMSAETMRQGHEIVEQGKTIGKVVLSAIEGH